MELQKIGVRAVVEQFDLYSKQIDAMRQQMQKTIQEYKGAEQATTRYSKTLQQVGQAAGGATGSGGAAGAFGALAGRIAVTVAVITGAAAALKGFFDLGTRGGLVKGVEESFKSIANSVGLASQALKTELREASGGMVSDFELMRKANIALAGATGEVGKQLGEALPRLMEIARAQARATGQDTDYLFQSLVTGIKRASPLLIDNTGLVLKIGEANEAYAAAVGKTVAELSAQDQQLAILQATLTAGESSVQRLKNVQLTAAEQSARLSASLENLRDKLGKLIEPVVGAAYDALTWFIDRVAEAVDTLVNLAKIFLLGGANLIGAFAGGILGAANTLLFPAIETIARAIADFLVGESPPPKGPLSKIDQGGANTMRAWLEGFVGVGLDPIAQVTAEVDAMLGGIGAESREAVTKRLEALDLALRPFEERLTLVKAQFEELKGPVDAAFNALDKQLDTAVQALARGEAGSAELVRQLDTQRDSLQGYVDAQQQAVDQAQIQLAFAKAQQAQERALLQIQLARLGPEEKIAAVREEVAKAPAKAAGGKAAAASGVPGAPLAPTVEEPTVEELDFGMLMGESFRQGADQYGQLSLAQRNVGNIQKQFDRISGADIGGRIGTAISNAFDPNKEGSILWNIGQWFQDTFNPDSPNSIWTKLGNTVATVDQYLIQPLASAFQSVFDPARPLSIPFEINRFVTTTLPTALSTAQSDLETNIITPLKDAFGSVLDPAREQSIPFEINRFVTQTLPTAIAAIQIWLDTYIIQPLSDKFDSVFNAEREGSVPFEINRFVNETLPTAVMSIKIWFEEQIIAPLADKFDSIFNPDREGSVPYEIGRFLNETLPNALTAARDWFQTNITGPIAEFFDSIFNADREGSIPFAVNKFANELLPNALNSVLNTFRDIFGKVGSILAEVAAKIGGVLQGLLEIIGLTSGGPGEIPNLLIEPEGLQFRTPSVGGATGGLFGPGLMRVGERGEEYIASASKLAVFPQPFVRAIDELTGLMSGFVYPSAGGDTTYDNSRNYGDIVLNGVPNGQDAMRRFALLQAGGG